MIEELSSVSPASLRHPVIDIAVAYGNQCGAGASEW